MKGKKTALVAFVLVLLGAAQGFDFLTLIDDPMIAGRVVSGIGVVMLVLRAFTDTSIFTDR